MENRSAKKAGHLLLYKFRGLSNRERLEPIFRSQALYWPSISQLNDPFESRPRVIPPPMRNQLERLKVEKQAYDLYRRNGMARPNAKQHSKVLTMPGLLQARADEMMHDLPSVLEMYRIFSLAGNCESILLWSHYAEAHTGICLGFASDTQEFGQAIEVNYSCDLPNMDFFERDHEKIITTIALTKSKEWKYEQEFRLVSQEPTMCGLPIVKDHWYCFRPENLVEVIMGCNIKPTDENFVRDMVAACPSPIKLRRAVRSTIRFGFEFIDT